jgi:hypothetical protein
MTRNQEINVMNQQENREDDTPTVPLADLSMTDEQAELTKAGHFTPRFSGGVYVAAGDLNG